jgi:hypothetical protein
MSIPKKTVGPVTMGNVINLQKEIVDWLIGEARALPLVNEAYLAWGKVSEANGLLFSMIAQRDALKAKGKK